MDDCCGNKCSIAAAALARCLLVYWCHKFQTLIALSRNSSALLPWAAGGLVSYIASLFLLKRLCASDYVYFASLDDVCTQNELAFLRGWLGSEF